MKKMNLLETDDHGAVPAGALPEKSFNSLECDSISIGTSSKGNQRKWKTLDGLFYIKESFYYMGVAWKDYLVEKIASRYAALCHLPPYVHVVRQGLCYIDRRPASYSEAFDTDDSYFISFLRENPEFERVGFPKHAGYLERFQMLVKCYTEVVGSYAENYIPIMTLLDIVVGNEDRHLNNFGYLMTTGGLVPAPLFDFGLGLFEHDPMYNELYFPKAIKKVRLKPVGWNIDQAIDCLKACYPDCLDILPKRVTLSDFQFPSTMAAMYFRYVNERLGVSIA